MRYEWSFVDWLGLGSGRGIAGLRRLWFEFLRTWEEFHNPRPVTSASWTLSAPSC